MVAVVEFWWNFAGQNSTKFPPTDGILGLCSKIPPKFLPVYLKFHRHPTKRKMPLHVQNFCNKMHTILESTLPGSGTTGKIPWNNWNILVGKFIDLYE